MENKKQLVKIYWQDAVIYKKPSIAQSLVKKTIIGEIIKKGRNFIIMKNPQVFEYIREEKKYIEIVPEKKITYFYIPKGMITAIEK